MKLKKIKELLTLNFIVINFLFFVLKSFFKIRKKNNILFYITKRKYVGSGFGHNSIILNIMRNRNLNFKDILIIDFTIGVTSNKYNIFNNFGLKVINFQPFLKRFNNQFYFKQRKKFINIASVILKKFGANVISSLDDFYLGDLKNRKIFFDNYERNQYLNSHSKILEGKRLYILEVSRANKDMMEAINSNNFKENNFLKLDKFENEKIQNRLSLKIDNTKKNILLYRRYKKNDYKCGSPDINYYLKIIDLINPKFYNVICVGDFEYDERKQINKIGAISNLDFKNDSIFYIWGCNNSSICLLECGGGLSLPLMMGKKSIIFNSVALAHLMPNTIILPKNYIKDDLSLSYNEILINHMGPYHIKGLKLDYTDIGAIKKEFDFLINNPINEYTYKNLDFMNNKNIKLFKKYNQFISNYWVDKNL